MQRFLGPPEASGGALALLSLDPASVDERAVFRALNAQLARVSAHPERDTPAADEVRLALHAAAAQLLDPAVRALIIARARGGRTPSGDGARPTPSRSPAPQPGRSETAVTAGRTPSRDDGAIAAFEHDALRLLARHGGWGPQSMRQIAQFAHARGVPPSRVVAGLHAMLRGGSTHANAGKPAIGSSPLPVRTNGAHTHPSAFTDQVVSASTAQAVSEPVFSSTATLSTVGARARQSRQTREALDPTTVRTLWFAGGMLVVFAGLLLLVFIGIHAASGGFGAGGGAGPGAGVQAQAPPPPTGSGAAASPDAEPTRDRSLDAERVRTDQPAREARTDSPAPPVDPARLVRDLQAAVAQLDDDAPAASARFASLVDALARRWTLLSASERAAAHDAVVEFVYRSADSPVAIAGAIRAIARPASAYASSDAPPAPGEVHPTIWSVGVLARLSRERDLPASARSEIERTLARALGDRGLTGERVFVDASIDALRAVAERLATRGGGARAWDTWLQAAHALAGEDPARRTALIIRGLDVLLERGPQPSESPEIFAAIAALVGDLPWRERDATRAWLVGRFDDPRITIGALHALTMALVRHSSAEGVDLTMVVRRRDTEAERRAMRDRYAEAWGIDAPAGGGAWAAAWGTTLRRASDADARHASAWLRRAVVVSMLNESAALAWSGDSAGADSALTEAEAFLNTRSAATGSGRAARLIEHAPADGWWSRYLRAGASVPARLDLLRDLGHRGPANIYRQDATVLVREALRGSPAQVRETAMQTMRRLTASPAVVNALLDELPRLPDTRGTRELIASVAYASTNPREGEPWHHHARRSLVARLLEMTASAGELSAVDDLADRLAMSYARRAANPGASESDAVAAGVSAASIRVRLEQAASALPPGARVPITLEEIERRRSSRASLAHGSVQRFCVEQLAVCELLAYIVVVERPREAGRVTGVLDTLARERREADHVFAQIAAAERAIASLWRIRFGEQDA
ncbi:MAG: hypothetical protein EA378_11190 [Phycisphaerales bacterium]|nr:MAG: hypothetical protein EA378_11190 [Phycisphaerales bacterium]